MASVAVMASASSLVATTAATVSPSSMSRTRSGMVSSSSPLALKRSFCGAALRSSKLGTVRRSVDSLVVRATSSSEETATDASKQVDELVADLKTKWAGVENKSSVAVYAGGALVTLWLSSTIIGAVNSVPLLPKILELVGLGYTGWFVYRYLLFKSSRKELVSDIEELKGKITGATGSITGKEE